LAHYQHKRENKMRHRNKEVREPFNKAQSFGRRLEKGGKNVLIFPPDQTVRSYTAQNADAFHETPNPLQRVHERHNIDVTQMIF
jgi:hypothetical protein